MCELFVFTKLQCSSLNLVEEAEAGKGPAYYGLHVLSIVVSMQVVLKRNNGARL